MSEFNTGIVDEFRSNDGIVTSHGFAETPLLLLHTRGARTGEPRINPLAWFPYSQDRLIVASAGGRPKNPSWVHNLRADPSVTIEVGRDTEHVTATELAGNEYEAGWRSVTSQNANFARYQERAARRIPVFRLSTRA